MPATRSKVNLAETSIHDHLWKNNKTKHSATIDKARRLMVDPKQSPTSSKNPTHQSHRIAEGEENQGIGKLSTALSGTNAIGPMMNHASQEVVDSQHEFLIEHDEQNITGSLLFSGKKSEDAGQWLDYILEIIEQQELTSREQRDIAATRLTGDALLWYRLNRLKMPDMQSFSQQFMITYNKSQGHTSGIGATLGDEHQTKALQREVEKEKEFEQVDGNTWKAIMEQNRSLETPSRYNSPFQVLQSARNEKVKLSPNFSGAENSLQWLKNLQQIGKSLKLNEQQIYELATIKLSGPAQEWFYHQDEDIEDWASFKQLFLSAFPPPVQPTKVDYVAQLLARKQGETEPVGKFVQDINRLCLKLDGKTTEQDKLQYLRRGLRPQLQHYALSITSVQDFLTIMQRHEQIEKDIWQQLTVKSSSRATYRQSPVDRYEPTDRYSRSNSNVGAGTQRSENEHRICYQCNKRGHVQRDCPDNKFSQQQYQSSEQRYQQQSEPRYQQEHKQPEPKYQQEQQQFTQQDQQQHFQQRRY